MNGGHTIAGFGTQKAANTLLQSDTAVRSSLDQLSSLLDGAQELIEELRQGLGLVPDSLPDVL